MITAVLKQHPAAIGAIPAIKVIIIRNIEHWVLFFCHFKKLVQFIIRITYVLKQTGETLKKKSDVEWTIKHSGFKPESDIFSNLLHHLFSHLGARYILFS